jgi:hypothetical protein
LRIKELSRKRCLQKAKTPAWMLALQERGLVLPGA